VAEFTSKYASLQDRFSPLLLKARNCLIFFAILKNLCENHIVMENSSFSMDLVCWLGGSGRDFPGIESGPTDSPEGDPFRYCSPGASSPAVPASEGAADDQQAERARTKARNATARIEDIPSRGA
jgi:hypothetical protein